MFWIKSATPEARSRIVRPIIAYQSVCRALVTLSAFPPEVIKRKADHKTIIVEIVIPIPKSQVAIASIKVGMSPDIRGLGMSITAPIAILVIITKNKKKINPFIHIFIIYLIKLFLTTNSIPGQGKYIRVDYEV